MSQPKQNIKFAAVAAAAVSAVALATYWRKSKKEGKKEEAKTEAKPEAKQEAKQEAKEETKQEAKQESKEAKQCEPGANVLRIVLTGGPCGGKTTGMNAIAATLKEQGFDVYNVPEVPTILIGGGCKYPGLEGGDALFAFEKHLIQLQVDMELAFESIAASTGRPSVLLLDRGLLDVPAYLPRDMWLSILERNGWTEEQFLKRYDMVIHLVTAAYGATEFYTTANNAARSETVEQAQGLDDKVRACWAGHARHVVIDNSTAFKEKLARCSSAVTEFITSLKPKN